MKRIVLLATAAAVMALAMALSAGIVAAQAPGPAQLVQRGWTCFDVSGPLGVHCQPPGADASDATIPLKVYDTQDPTAEQAPFLGTEILIREDLYHGQPCPQEGLEEYELLPNGYYACHHYG